MLKLPGRRGLKHKLLEKSTDAYVLALEIINQLSVTYRVEAFLYLICNAWELLLKAKILHDGGKRSQIYYPKRRGQPRRTLSLRDALQRVIPNDGDSMRRNVARLAELRDESTHLVIGRVPVEVIGLFQASVLNYHRLLGDWFGLSLSDKVPVGMMALVYDFDPMEFDLTQPRLRRELGKETADYLLSYTKRLREDYDEAGCPPEFLIDIGYRLDLVKRQDTGDITLSTGVGGNVVAVVDRPRDPSDTHPFLQKDLIAAVREALPEGVVFNKYDVQCIIALHGVKRRTEWFYKGKVKNSPSQYSAEFRDWILGRYRQNPDFFAEARRRYKQGQSG